MLGLSMVLFAWFSLCLWDLIWGGSNNPFPFGESYQKDPRSEIAEDVDIKDKNGKETIITRLLNVFNINIDKSSDHKFLDYVKAILNVALWLLSMVALVMTIYTFYLMFFTDNDKAAEKAKWNLVGIFIALAIIGLAWLIVSFIFRWYRENWQRRNEDIEKWNITINYELDNQFYLTT